VGTHSFRSFGATFVDVHVRDELAVV